MDEGSSGDLDPGKNAENPPEGDELDHELRAFLEGSASEAKFREPTAAEREKLAKRASKERAADAKSHAKLEKEARKKALREQRKTRRRARRRRLIRGTAWTVSVLVLAGACVFAYTRLHLTSGPGGVNDTQLVTNGAVPKISGGPVSPLTDSGPPADPFAGTPADKWANGAAGISIPAAKSHGRYSAAQVESAYRTTRKMLIAAALDNQTLNGGAPTAFARLLTQDERNQFLRDLNKIGIDKYGSALSTRGLIMQFAPGTTKLIGSVIKVRGTMSAQAAKDPGGNPILRINVNYLFTYAVEPPKAPADWMRIVSQFYGRIDFGSRSAANSPFEPWWNAGPSVAGARCATRDGFVHPEYPSGPPDSVQPSGPAKDPYSFAKPGGSGCGTTTGT